jgi:acetylornithine deacetylase/succinyl-diaminopimelate desuccinylase-like protein
MKNTYEYIDQHIERFQNEMFDLLRIPSVSTNAANQKDLVAAAAFLSDRLQEAGLDEVTIHPTPGNSIVTGVKIVDPSLPTVLIYGHYDVQPEEPLELWTSPPFEPTVKDGKVYARGASDDKGQAYTHVKAIESLYKTTGTLPVNVKVLLEGEEEIGSPNLRPFLEKHKDYLSCDMVLISDTSMFAEDTPSITVGLRGLAYMQLKLTGPNRDLHSGVYGGAVENPANVLCEVLAKLKDADGVIKIPGFYDKVKLLTEEERSAYKALPFDEEAYKKHLGIDAVHGEKGYSTLERASARPTLDINGLTSGYQGEGAKTVLPSVASAKVSMRLVPDQDPKEIAQLFIKHVKSLIPPTIKAEIEEHHGGHPAGVDLNFYGLKAASTAFEKVYNKAPFYSREGGSIPIVADFKQVLNATSILMGFGLNSDAIHSPNEHFALKDYHRGIKTSATFLNELATTKA